jgi:hypothetical protein
MPRRWEDDARGRGIGNATRLVAGATDLIDAFRQPAWVAEQPEAHLRPHIEDWCSRDGRLAVRNAHSEESGAYVVDLEWRGDSGGVGEARAAVFALIGSFAEAATYVRQRRIPADGNGSAEILQFEVGTGELAPDSRFDPHGHVVVIEVRGVLERSTPRR